MQHRPRLHPAVAQTRTAVKNALLSVSARTPFQVHARELVQPPPFALVALSGGGDSLALAAALSFEAPKLGWRAGAVIVDHALQAGSGEVAERAAEQARALGLTPVKVRRVAVPQGAGGPEAAARHARYRALAEMAEQYEAAAILTAHTRDDQAEQVLLAMTRGSGVKSLAGIPRERGVILRPFLGLSRETTLAACTAQGLQVWKDPHNDDSRFTRVRVRHTILPVLEEQLGPGIREGLARTAELAREDAEALEMIVDKEMTRIVESREDEVGVFVEQLTVLPAAIRQRVIRRVAFDVFGSSLTREHTLAIARLVTNWKGQGAVNVPGIRVFRQGSRLVFTAMRHSPRMFGV